MKEKIRSYTFYLKFLLIILLFVFLSACGGVTPGTDFSTIPDTAALAVGDYFQGGKTPVMCQEKHTDWLQLR